MKVAVIGNCQIGVIIPMLRAIHGNTEATSLPAVHDMNESHREMVERECSEADWIFSQPINNDYRAEYVRTNILANIYKEKLVIFPNSYFSGYAPDWFGIHDESKNHYYGPLRSYHSSKLLFSYFSGFSVDQAIEFLRQPTEFDERHYKNAVDANFEELKNREKSCNVIISDFIEKYFRESRLFHIMNHPNIFTLGAITERLLNVIGEKHIPVHPSLFTDFDLIEAWHPENAYIRSKEELKFEPIECYRGVQLFEDARSPNGFIAGLPKMYDTAQMVAAFYKYYAFNEESLREHWRVRDVVNH